MDEINDKYSNQISVEFNVECTNVGWENENQENEVCHLSLSKQGGDKIWTVSSKFVIGADGASSKIREVMQQKKEKRFFVSTFEDKNVRVYKTLPMHFPPNNKQWRKDLNYSARTKSDINLDALPTKEGGYLGAILYRPWDDRLNKMKDVNEARVFFDTIFPMFSTVVKDDDLEEFVRKPASKLPKFMFCGPALHKGKSTVLIGDTIHTVKPYFGQGVNAAFEDVKILHSSLDKADGICSFFSYIYCRHLFVHSFVYLFTLCLLIHLHITQVHIFNHPRQLTLAI